MPPADVRAEVERLLAADPDVPGLRLLLDDDALTAWVGDRLGPAAVAGGVRRTYLRWKPGAGGVARVRLDGADGADGADLFLAVWHPDAAAKLTKTDHRGGPAVVTADPDALAVLARPAADRDLPALRRLVAPGAQVVVDRLQGGDEAARQLLRRAAGAPGTPGVVRTLAWKPQRRWVGTVGTPGTGQVVLRACRPDVAPGVVGRYRAVASALGDGAPRVLGADLRHGLVAVQHVPGLTLDRWPTTVAQGTDASSDPDPTVTAAAFLTGELLARLHASPAAGPDVPVLSVADECSAVEAAATTLHLLAPRSRARSVAQELVRRLHGAAPERGVLLHGDLSPDQVVLRTDGGVGLIDLDEAVRGPAGYDLAGVAASWALQHPSHAVGLLEQLHAGYGRHRDLPPTREALRVRTAAHLLRRAPEPFRTGSATWPAEVAHAVEVAAQVLDGVHDGHAAGSRRSRRSPVGVRP